ncbi:MAG TPA: DUF58 domain-containing protein [Anaerolineae bacterium]|nr:DUF58 domain-containing protein [Anaerolineae bacterium]
MGNFIVFILILFALAALLRIDFFFSILYLFAGVYVLSHLWSRRMLKNLRISRALPQRAFLGDRVTVTLKLENLSRLPIPWLLLSETLPIALTSPPFLRQVITLSGKASYSLPYTLHARQRGYYLIGPLSLQTGDLLGLKRQLTSSVAADYLIIYPKIVPIAQLGLPTHSPQVILPTPVPLFQDPARLIGVRNYYPGDNPRQIHWPATATTGQLLIKQFQPAIARDNVICLNLDRDDYAQHGYPDPAIELAIVVAASLANHMLGFEKLPVGLSATAIDPLIQSQQDFQLPPRKGRSQLIQILEILARVQAATQTQFLERLRREAVHLSWGTTLMVITSGESPELLETLLLLKQSGFQPTLVLVTPPGRQQSRVDLTRKLNIPVYRIRREKEVEIWSASP